MKKYRLFVLFLLVVLVASAGVAPAVADPVNATALNARFTHFQEQPQVIHLFVFNDDGRPGQPPAVVQSGQPVLFGFEWDEPSLAELQANYLDNPNHDILLSVDGSPSVSVKSLYQTPFIAIATVGPAWSWDHDGDGPGDGDGDGIADWDGPVMFFRYQHLALDPGTHAFDFNITNDGGATYDFSDTITVQVE